MLNASMLTPLLIDLVALVLLLLFALNGRRRGIVKTLSGIIALILAFYLAGWLTQATTPYLSEHYVEPWLYNSIMPEMKPVADVQQPAEDSIVDQIGDALNKIGFPENSVQDFLDHFKIDVSSSLENAVTSTSRSLGYKLTYAGCYILYFLLLLLVLRLFARLLDSLAHIPGLNLINRMLGLLLGLLFGYLTILVVSYILSRTGVLLSDSLIGQTRVLRFLLSVSPF